MKRCGAQIDVRPSFIDIQLISSRNSMNFTGFVQVLRPTRRQIEDHRSGHSSDRRSSPLLGNDSEVRRKKQTNASDAREFCDLLCLSAKTPMLSFPFFHILVYRGVST